MSDVFIGTSGWNYDHWGDFYAGVKKADRLSHYAGVFNGVEVNASYYRLQERSTFEKWREQVPADFRFAIKANRYLVQNRKLKEPEEPVHKEKERADALGDQLGAVLWQLPASLERNLERLAHFAAVVTKHWPVQHTVEFRHSSWFEDDTADCLRKHNIAVCQSDAADWPLWQAVTADFVYIRLHGHTRTYYSAYSSASLERWAEGIREWLRDGRDVFVFFDNDAEGAAPKDAQKLRELVSKS